MKEQLVSLLESRVGLDHDKAEKAADACLDFLRDKAQSGELQQLLSHVGGKGLADQLGGLFGHP